MKNFDSYKPNLKPVKSLIGLPSILKNKTAYATLVVLIALAFSSYFFIQKSKLEKAKEQIANANTLMESMNDRLIKDREQIITTLDDYFYDDRSAPELKEKFNNFPIIEIKSFEQLQAEQNENIAKYEEAMLELENNFYFINQEDVKALNSAIVTVVDGQKVTRSMFDDDENYVRYKELIAIRKPNDGLKGLVADYNLSVKDDVAEIKENIAEIARQQQMLQRILDQGQHKKREPKPEPIPAPDTTSLPKEEVKSEVQEIENIEEKRNEASSQSEVAETKKEVVEAKKAPEKKAVEKPKKAPQQKSSVPVW